jgi:hypothetical protein
MHFNVQDVVRVEKDVSGVTVVIQHKHLALLSGFTEEGLSVGQGDRKVKA